MSEPAKTDNHSPNTISSLFEDRDRLPSTSQEAEPQAVKNNENDSTKSAVTSSGDSISDETLDAKSGADKAENKNAQNNPDLKTLQAELEKNRKTILENQKYGRQNAQRLKGALKQAKILMENGALSEEEGMSLITSLESDHEEEVETSPYDAHPFGKVLKIANTQLENLRKYSDDDLLDDKVKAFDYFLSLASPEEVKGALEDLTELIEDPIKLTKKMLSIGKLYYDESYKDIASAGSVQNYIKQKHEEIEKLNKNIDKLTKKLAQYEDYDQPRNRINEVGESNDTPPGKRDPSDDLFHERDKDDMRRQKRLA
jgi:hypothetical protein